MHPTILLALSALLAAPALGSDQPLGLTSVSVVSSPAQDPLASLSSAENPVRVSAGDSVTLSFAGPSVLPGDMVALAPPGSSRCGECLEAMDDVDDFAGSAGLRGAYGSTVGAAVDAGLAACGAAGFFAPAVVAGDLTATVTAAAGSAQGHATGRSLLCYRRRIVADPRDPRAASQTVARYRAWQWYGESYGIAVVTVARIDRDTFYRGQLVPTVTVSGSNLRTGDMISIGNEDGTCASDPAAVAASHVAALVVSGTAPAATATVSALRPTVANSADAAAFTICWANSAAASAYAPTVLQIRVRALTRDLGVYWLFPRAVEADTGEALKRSARVRIGGWNLRDGDRVALSTLHTDCRAVADTTAARLSLTYERKEGTYDTAHATFPAGHVYNVPGTSGVGPVDDDTAVEIKVCYYPVGLDDSEVPTTYSGGWRETPLYAVSATRCLDGGNATADLATHATRITANDFAAVSAPAALPRGVEVTAFVSGCTVDGDAYGFRDAAVGSCAVDANVDYLGTAGENAVATVSDASWPRITGIVRSSAPADAALCVVRGGSKARVGVTTFKMIGSTGDPAASTASAWAPPAGITKPLWVMAGVEMPLLAEITTGNTAGNEEYLLTTGETSEACVTAAVDARSDSSPAEASPWLSPGSVAPLSGGPTAASMAFFVPASADVAATRTLRVCARVDAGDDGATPWILGGQVSVKQHPRLTAFPLSVQKLDVAGVDRTGFITFSGVISGDQVSYSEELGAEGECQIESRAERRPIDLTREASFTRVDGEASQLSNTTDGTQSWLCVSRDGDDRSYLLKGDSGSAVTTRESPTLDGFPTAVYAKTARDIPITGGVLYRGDQVGLATAAGGCATSTGIAYAQVSFDYGHSAKVSAFEFGTSSLPPAGPTKLCVLRLDTLTPVEYSQSVRVARVESTYAGVSGTAANKAIKVDHYVSFYVHGDDTRDMRFRGTNVGSEDNVAFALEGQCGSLATPGTYPKTTVDGSNRLISKDDVTGKFTPSDQGGTFELCYRACDDAACNLSIDAWVGTGHTLLVVRVTASFPNEAISADPHNVYITGEGIAAGDIAYYSDAGPCISDRNANPPLSASPTAAQFDSVARTVAAVASSSSSSSSSTTTSDPLRYVPFSPADFSQLGATYSKICYVPQGTEAQHSSSAFAEFSTAALVVSSSRASSIVPTISPDDLAATGTEVRLFAGTTSSVSLTGTGGSSLAPLSTEYAVRFVAKTTSGAAADCTTAAVLPDAKLVKDASSLTGFTAPLNPADKTDDMVLCWRRTIDGDTSGATPVALSSTVTVKVVSATGVTPNAIVRGTSSSTAVTIDGAVGTGTEDTVCLVKAGSAAPAHCGTTPSTDGHFAVTSSGTFSVPSAFPAASDAGAYDVYYQAGGARVDTSVPRMYPTPPVLISSAAAGAGITFYALDPVPSQVLVTDDSGSTADARKIFLGPAVTPGDFVSFTSALDCTGAAAAAVAVAADRSVTVLNSFPSAGSYTACIRPVALFASGTTAADADFRRVSSALVTAVTTPSVAMGAASQRVQPGVASELTFTGTVQPDDEIRVLSFGATCAAQSATQDDTLPAGTSTVARTAGTLTLSYARVGLGSVNLPHSAVRAGYPVCFRPARPESAATGPWYPVTVTPTIDAVSLSLNATAGEVAPLATAEGHLTQFHVFAYNAADGDRIALVNAADTSCALAWRTETAIGAGLPFSRITFTAALPAGLYRLCYTPKDTEVWRLYNGDADALVRVVGAASVRPVFAAAELPTSFGVVGARSGARPGTAEVAQFAPGDSIAFVDAAARSCDAPSPLPSGYPGYVNVTVAGSAATATAAASILPSFPAIDATVPDYVLAGLKTGRSHRMCVRLAGGKLYGAAAADLAPAIRLSTRAATEVTAWRIPRLRSVTPSAVRPNEVTPVVFSGAFLDGADVASLNVTGTGSCAGAAKVNVTMAGNATNGISAVAGAAPGVSLPTAGTWDVCYHHARPNATSYPSPPAEHGVRVEVVDVARMNPTGAYPTAGEATVEITFSGHFDLASEADFVALIPSKDANGVTVTNCSSVDPLRDLRPVRLDSAGAGRAQVNATHVADEYAVCFAFGGVLNAAGGAVIGKGAVAGPVSVSTGAGVVPGVNGPVGLASVRIDLLPVSHFVFSVRQVDRFSPLQVANGTAQELTFEGPGVRAGDQVVLVPVTAASGSGAEIAVTACVREAATVSNILLVTVPAEDATVKRGRVAVNAPAGTFRICYRFAAPEVPADDWKIVGTSDGSATLTSARASVDAVRAALVPSAGPRSAARLVPSSETVDSGSAALVVVEGPGVGASGDMAALVPIAASGANATGAADPCSGAAVSWRPVFEVRRSEWGAEVAGGDPGFNAGVAGFVVHPGDLASSRGPYALCYSFATAGHAGRSVQLGGAAALTFAPALRVRGNFPRTMLAAFVNSSAPSNFTVLGDALNATFDRAALVPVDATATAAGACATAFSASVGAIGTTDDPTRAAESGYGPAVVFDTRALLPSSTGTSPTVSAPAVYALCYFPGGVGGTVPIAVSDALVIGGFGDDGTCREQLACGPSARYRCGCSCRATPCADAQPTCEARLPGFVFCASSGSCAAGPNSCPLPGSCNGLHRCPQGNCAKDRDGCAPLPSCPARSRRCLDGTCSAILGTCVTAAGANITEPLCPAGRVVCEAGTCPSADGSCPHFNGCPPRAPFRCGDCSCAADEAQCAAPAESAGRCDASSSFPVPCADGSCAERHDLCRCSVLEKFSEQIVSMSNGGGLAPSLRRRRAGIMGLGRYRSRRSARPSEIIGGAIAGVFLPAAGDDSRAAAAAAAAADGAWAEGAAAAPRPRRHRAWLPANSDSRRFVALASGEAVDVWLSSDVVVRVPARYAGYDDCDLEILPVSDSQAREATAVAGGTFRPVSLPVHMRLMTRGNSSHPRTACPLASNSSAVNVVWRARDTPSTVVPGCSTIDLPTTLADPPVIDAANGTEATASSYLPGALECPITGRFTLDTVAVLSTGVAAPVIPSPSPEPSPSATPTPSAAPSATPTPEPSPDASATPISASASPRGLTWHSGLVIALAMAALVLV